ncbi:LacI family DNA-binding transcriptional regulator [Anaerosacchariphilus polymeriproducens]|uniref:LacI family transcriptional regulator n=1 Tax=Anaerosacchariphilus polymeriproducens TaxID=1812858 RepID=A0A371ARH6_9FIRM|nr:LacI family DNA-binding transcriptional regulator [Anaerosacchariphilus polymeriproducens]RDU22070.1 LacI family transcriptional regulator [Anaerosacchariphilus polymeriproducens]
MGKVRLADIAEKVGVSAVTVHNALAGHKGVSDEMRFRIQKEAESMGYQQPVPSVKKKINGLTQEDIKIGVIIAENYLAQYATFYWKMYQELTIAASEKGCFTMVEVLKKENEKLTLQLPKVVTDQSIEGLIIIGEIDKKYIAKLKRCIQIPIVFLDFYDKILAKDAVITDNFYGMYLMTELLFEQGMEDIGFVGSIYATSSIMDRYCGFMKSMLEHKKKIWPEWLIEDRDEFGQVKFELPQKLPKAFVCNCDLAAGILVQKLSEKGYRVPEDISIVGFDNYLYPGLADMKITTYEVNTKAMTKVALNKVLKQIKSSKAGRGLDIVSGHMVIKQSVKMKQI